MRPARRIAATVAFLVLATSLAGCGGDGGDANRDAAPGTGDAAGALPRPQAGTTSVTGMPGPDSGGATIQLGEMPAAPQGLEADLAAVMPPSVDDGLAPLLEDNPETGLAAPGALDDARTDPGTATARVDDAVARVQAYYGAIDRGDLVSAYALWGDGGAASGQSPAQFANGFADVAAIRVTPGEATAAGAGDRVDVPVTVTSTRRDGSEQTSVGLYVLRATADGRDWRIVDARLRPLQP